MTKWRVGSVSMGISLILLGLLFFFAQTDTKIMTKLLMSWWPVVFIILGAEILLYVFLSKSEKMQVKYDVFSILFVGFLGSMCILFTLFASMGLLQEVQQAVSSVEMTKQLPTIQRAVPQTVNKIVVQAFDQPVKVEGNTERAVRLFGEYRTSSSALVEETKNMEQNYATVQTIGDVMYVTMHPLPRKSGFNSLSPNEDVTLVLPQTVDVEIRGKQNQIEVTTGVLRSNWTIKSNDSVKLNVAQQSDLQIVAVTVQQPESGNLKWSSVTQEPSASNSSSSQDPGMSNQPTERSYHSQAILGKGTYRLQVIQANDVTVNQL